MKKGQGAQKLGVNGWVRNLPDRRVEAVFEGEKEAVDKSIKSVKKGPSYVSVIDLGIQWKDYNGEFSDFSYLLLNVGFKSV